jgi:hypothetical protein
VAAHALPTTLPDGDIQHLTEEISQAKGDLEGMVNDNRKEISVMNVVSNDIIKAQEGDMSAVKEQETMAAAKDMEAKETVAVANENDQQKLALDSLSQVNEALEEINSKNTLGESQTNPVEAAAQKLSKLKKQLELGTSTSHNLERIERMEEESKRVATDAKDLAEFAKMSAPGKLGDAAPELGGVMGMLNSARASAEPAQAQAAAPAQDGVMGMLNNARASAATAQAAGGSRADRLLSQEQETLAQLGSQTARATKAEKLSVNQLKGMIKDMA